MRSGLVTPSRVLIALGILTLAWAALFMTSNSIGSPPEELGFAHRKSYNEIKASVHASMLGMLWRAALGGVLIWIGTRVGPKGEDAA
jgi:hypothetical protein